MKSFILLIALCLAVSLQAQDSQGLTPDQILQLQEYATRKGLKADFSKAPIDSLNYEKVEQSIDSVALLPDKVLVDWENFVKDREYFLLLQSENFQNDQVKILEDGDTEGVAFPFRSYLVSDTTGLFVRFKPHVKKEMRAVRILQSWPVSRLEEEYRGRGINPYNQEIIKVLRRLLQGELMANEDPWDGHIELRYQNQPIYLIFDNPDALEIACAEYVFNELLEDEEEKMDLDEVNLSAYTLPMLNGSVEYSLRDLQWIILADVGGKNAILLLSNEIPRIKLSTDNTP